MAEQLSLDLGNPEPLKVRPKEEIKRDLENAGSCRIDELYFEVLLDIRDVLIEGNQRAANYLNSATPKRNMEEIMKSASEIAKGLMEKK